MKKQIRYGKSNIQKARLAPITEQQIAEICEATGETKSDCIQAAITERYMRIVHDSQQKRIDELEAAVLKLEAALVEASTGDDAGFWLT